ncbi:MAG: DUF4834 domain-containing protein [Marinilabiliales bacterium]|nr:MAG: DUF4834 domain-containing protein [Marinilabiliales bacterium]
MGFLKFLLGLLIFYLLAVLLFRYVITWLLKRWVRNAARKINPDFDKQEKQKNKKAGDVSIDFIPEKDEESDNDDGGEYVDYEEIK